MILAVMTICAAAVQPMQLHRAPPRRFCFPAGCARRERCIDGSPMTYPDNSVPMRCYREAQAWLADPNAKIQHPLQRNETVEIRCDRTGSGRYDPHRDPATGHQADTAIRSHSSVRLMGRSRRQQAIQRRHRVR
jgi:hypothetical protein